MPYNPNMYNPQYQANYPVQMSQPNWPSNYQNYQQAYPVSRPQQQIVDKVIRVTGFNGAVAYAKTLGPNVRDAAFDDCSDIFYWITTDAGGFPTIKMYDFYPREIEEQNPQSNEYATKDSLQKLQNEMEARFSGITAALEQMNVAALPKGMHSAQGKDEQNG